MRKNENNSCKLSCYQMWDNNKQEGTHSYKPHQTVDRDVDRLPHIPAVDRDVGKSDYHIEELDFDSCAGKKAPCLEKTNSTFYLKRNHGHYYQAQQ